MTSQAFVLGGQTQSIVRESKYMSLGNRYFLGWSTTVVSGVVAIIGCKRATDRQLAHCTSFQPLISILSRVQTAALLDVSVILSSHPPREVCVHTGIFANQPTFVDCY